MALFASRKPVTREDDANTLKKTTKKAKVTYKNPIDEINLKVTEALGRFKDKYKAVQDETELSDLIDEAIKVGEIAIDTETSGLDIFRESIAGWSFSFDGEKGYYVPINHRSRYTQERYPGQLTPEICCRILQKLKDNNTNIIFHNAKFDIKVIFLKIGLKLGCYWDTQIAATLINPMEPHGLKYLYHKYVEQKDDDEFFKFSDLFDKMDFRDVPISTGMIYAAHDTVMTLKLYRYQKDLFNRDKSLAGIYRLFREIETPLTPIIADMELYGVKINKEYAKQLSDTYNGYLKEAQKNFYTELDKYDSQIRQYSIKHPGKLSQPLNYASPGQLAILLYDILNVGIIDKDKPRGTGEEILEKVEHPIAKAILECRKYEKLVGTYIDKLPSMVDEFGYLHAKFNQVGTDTGRFSSSDPNLQNIPAHDKYIRKMFVATDGYYMVGADYSQQEPRILAFLTRDDHLLGAYREKKDVYAMISSRIYHKPYEDCVEFFPDGTTNYEAKERRGKCKQIVLGIMYGRGVASIAEQLGISKKEATDIYNSFFTMFPSVKKFVTKAQDDARKVGYVTTIWGRRRLLPDMMLEKYEITAAEGFVQDFDPLDFGAETKEGLDDKTKRLWINKLDKAWGWKQRSQVIAEAREQGIYIKENDFKISEAERQCVNSIIQGSAADMSKLAILKIANDEEMKKLDFHIQILVHDEIIGECPKQNAKRCAERLTELMIEASNDKLDIPMKCDSTISDCWTGEEMV